VPALVRVLAEPSTPEVKRARIALLLGLLAEGRDDGQGRAALAGRRAAWDPRYLEILGDSKPRPLGSP